jgi:hypothetical protein
MRFALCLVYCGYLSPNAAIIRNHLLEGYVK